MILNMQADDGNSYLCISLCLLLIFAWCVQQDAVNVEFTKLGDDTQHASRQWQ